MSTIDQIIDADYKKNHTGREYSLEDMHKVFKNYVARGGHYYHHDKTLFLLEEKPNKKVEFHSVNGGNSKDLVEGINALLTMLSKHFDEAITYYDNEKIHSLFEHCKFPVSYKKVNQGPDKTYMAEFNLKD